jgi:heavy metal sensor kinase
MFTLQGRLVLVNVAVLLVALILLAVIVLNQVIHDLYERLDWNLQVISRHELAWVEIVDRTPVFTANVARSHPKLGPEGFVRLLDRQEHLTSGLGPYESVPVSFQSQIIPPQGVGFNQTTQTGLLLRVYTLPLLDDNIVVGYIQVADDQQEIQETIDHVRRSLIIGLPLALLISGLLSFIAARQALRPLTKMTHSAATINAESLDKRLPVSKAKDEVQALALAFNATLDRLTAAFARQRRFTADASHELRTPVTAILGQAELALSRPRSPEVYQQNLTRIQSEAERMQRLIGRMLSLARLETNMQPLTLAPTDIAGLVRTLTDTLQPRAAAKGLVFKVDTPPVLTISTDADCLTQILLNLLENAIAYTDHGSVELSLTADTNHIYLKVSDSGQRIPPEHLPYIFQPFYRVDPARSPDQGRVGLGLALTYELVYLLEGIIEVTSQPQLGTTFSLTLPTELNK